jgi:hypothetical protein
MAVPTRVGWGSAAITTGTGFSVTISAGTDAGSVWDPAENDFIIVWVSSQSTISSSANTANWTNVLGNNVASNHTAAALGQAAWWHRVTSGEATANTTTYAETVFTANETGNAGVMVVRGVHTTTPINVFNTIEVASVTPHILAGLTSATSSQPTVTDCLVVSCVAKDATGAYTNNPAGWTQASTFNTNQGKWWGHRTAATTAGVDVAATNITPSAADEAMSITIALTPAPSAVQSSYPRRRRLALAYR